VTSERLRVALVINDLRRAGAETQLVRLATGLDRARFEIRVLILKTENHFQDELAQAGVPLTALGRRTPWDVAVLRRLERQLEAARPEVVHSFLPLANLLTSIAGRRARVPAVILSQRASYEATLGPAWRRIARWSHRRASHVIVNSEAARRQEIAAGFPAERITCVPNGIDVAATAGPVDRAALGVPAGPLVVCAAQFVEEKAHADLIEAWPRVRARFPSATLLLIGEGALRAAAENQAARLGLGGSVAFLGARHPVEPYLAAADVVVLPSRTEGMPNVLLEAMALGTAIVATAVGGIPEIASDGESGLLVPPARPEQLAGALNDLLGDGDRRQALGGRGRLAATRLSTARMVAATEAVYAAALGRETL